MRLSSLPIYRGKCYTCNRPQSSCMCQYVRPIMTRTQFIILMHPKEHQKTKNGTGYLTHLSLPNSQLFIGIDFTNHTAINTIIQDNNNHCMVLYPNKKALNLQQEQLRLSKKNLVIFIIDSTWACSKKILRLSQNLQDLPKVSFSNTTVSQFLIKKQPAAYCLSTIESTAIVLQLLQEQTLESFDKKALETFLNPFNKMVQYQLECANKHCLREENKK